MERKDKRPYFVIKGKLILFLRDRMVNIDGKDTFAQPATDIWDDVLPNDIHNEGGVVLRKGKKPEKLISRIIELCTNEQDIVMDFFAGSGTAAAVSTKKNRRFIAIEQLDYIHDLTVKRLINTINGEQSGISKNDDWKSGGSFIYAELHPLNYQFVQLIQLANSDAELFKVVNQMKEVSFLDFKVNIERIANDDEGFVNLSLDEKRNVLIEALDANQMYLNYSEINDATYGINDNVIAFNRSFYGEDVES